jgi:hypothetical protein
MSMSSYESDAFQLQLEFRDDQNDLPATNP